MRHALWFAAFATTIALTGSVAHAQRHHKTKATKKLKKAKHRKHARHVEETDVDVALRVQDEDQDDDRDVDRETDRDDEPTDLISVRRHDRRAPSSRDWHVAVGPYAWASAVDASVAVDGMKVDSPVDFAQLKHNIKYGGELLAEARYRRFAITGDLMFGAIGIEAQPAVGPLMVSVQGDVSALLFDGAAGYLLVGDHHSLISLEARGGIRYQRTAMHASVALEGAPVVQPDLVFAASDALLGGRVFVRPRERFYFTGSADVGVAGASSSTWSASIDASVHVSSHALFSLGYRTLTMDRSSVNVVLHGPRAAFQITF